MDLSEPLKRLYLRIERLEHHSDPDVREIGRNMRTYVNQIAEEVDYDPEADE